MIPSLEQELVKTTHEYLVVLGNKETVKVYFLLLFSC